MTEEQQNNNVSKEEAQEIVRHINESSSGIHSFLTKVIRAKDTTKTGNLDANELGLGRISLRGLKELQLFSKDIAEEDEWSDYFGKLAEIQTSTSLSKDAKLLNASVTQKKELADTSPQPTMKKNKGWFKKGENNNPQQQQQQS